MIDDLLTRIHAMGKENDASVSERERRMFNITPTTGMFLDVLVRDSRPKRILEIGTSDRKRTDGYPTPQRIAESVDESDGSGNTSTERFHVSPARLVHNYDLCDLTDLSECADRLGSQRIRLTLIYCQPRDWRALSKRGPNTRRNRL